MKLRLLFSLALLAAGIFRAGAASSKEASLDYVLGEVRIAEPSGGGHPATAREGMKPGASVVTGPQSRAELIFPDRRLTRLGAETALCLQPGAGDLRLDRGTLLLQVPKFHGARIHLGSLTASVGGATCLIEHLPGKSVKIVVLEGDLRLAVNGFLGDSIVLTPGKLLITKPDVQRIPEPVDVDLRTLAKTSSLINSARSEGTPTPAMAALPSMQAIERKAGQQEKLVGRKALIPTNLVIVGSGTQIVIPAENAVSGPGGGSVAKVEPAGKK